MDPHLPGRTKSTFEQFREPKLPELGWSASVSKETISRITDKVIEEMNDWAVRPLDVRHSSSTPSW